jgi:pyrroloquinoline-quinone synthase
LTVTVHPSFVHPLSEPGGDVAVLGGKGASLVRLSEAGFNVPDGFCLTTDAYASFVAANGLGPVITQLTRRLDPRDIAAAERVSGMLANYAFVTQETLAYFTPRMTQAPKDVNFALAYVDEHARTRAQQEQVLAALRFKCDVLWSQLDALHYAYVEPGRVPPGAFVPSA